jgi:hypothetical protein
MEGTAAMNLTIG